MEGWLSELFCLLCAYIRWKNVLSFYVYFKFSFFERFKEYTYIKQITYICTVQGEAENVVSFI